jgi:hypothetical protein
MGAEGVRIVEKVRELFSTSNLLLWEDPTCHRQVIGTGHGRVKICTEARRTSCRLSIGVGHAQQGA